MIVKLEPWFLNTATGALFTNEHRPKDILITLDHTPLELLLCLIRYQGEDVSKETMLKEVWPNKIVSEDVLSVAISQIRKALSDNARKPTFIKTIPSIGYRFIASTTQIAEYKPTAASIDTAVSFSEKTVLKATDIPTIKSHKKSVLFYAAVINIFIILFASYFYFQPEKSIHLTDFSSKAAIEKYQEARYLLKQDDESSWEKAQQAFEDTIIKEPNYAPVYRELADVKLKLIGWHHGEKTNAKLEELYYLLNKSLALAPDDPQSHVLMADVAFLVEWNFELAAKHYQAALTFKEDDALTHSKYAQFLLAAQDFDLAIAHIQRYIELDPTGYALTSVAWVYNMMENYPVALQELTKLRELEPDSFGYHISAQAILENMGDEKTSFNEMIKILEQSAYSEHDLHTVKQEFEHGGLKAVYLWLLEIKKEPAYIGQYQPPLSFARYAIKAGKTELAVEYIQQALIKRDAALLWFNVDPAYAPIRNHPALKNIINPK